jgi:D-3-phosphoglycerate dehydrogenase
MKRPKVVVTDHIFPSLEIERALLGAIGAEIVVAQATSEPQLVDIVTDADALLVCYAPVTKRVIERLSRCRVIARYGIGVDNVDVDAATARGIVVTNVPDYCIEEVSDHALALLLACARKIPFLDRRVRGGRWDARDAAPMHRLRGQVLGMVGFGKIPRCLARKARALGLELLAFDPYVGADEMAADGVRKVALEDLVAQADFVSVHAPLTVETRGLIGEALLRAMKPTAYVINTARGPLVSQDAIVRALREGWIAGAALDVLETEPPADVDALRAIETLIVTPHVAFYSEESVQELQRKAAENVVSVLVGEVPRYPVNTVRPSPR